jgi:hypothetical protein
MNVPELIPAEVSGWPRRAVVAPAEQAGTPPARWTTVPIGRIREASAGVPQVRLDA